jgi:hypothetical protein
MATETDITRIRPQEGFQMKFLSSPADIVIGGSAAGVGKTYSLLLEPLRNISVDGFGGVIFRRTGPQIRNEGGLWDTSMTIYPHVGATPRESFLEWLFSEGAKLKFSHLEHEKNVFDWQGAQIPYIGFDELTHFTKFMFFYLLSRNRSTCGIKPYVRAVCNPDPDSWLAEFISWWIDQNTGFPIPERDGVIRYMLRDGEKFIWGDSVEEVLEKGDYLIRPLVEKSGIDPREFIKSVTFISGSIYDNKELLKVNPGYLANLMAQDEQTKSQLLHNNWKVVISENDVYNYSSFIGMFDNMYSVKTGVKSITADIALKGSDKFTSGVWDGDELIDLAIMDKSDGKQVVDTIRRQAEMYRVQNGRIVYDNDGVGGFIDGFIRGAVPFINGAAPVEVKGDDGKVIKENYQNFKTQCYYHSGDAVNKGKHIISEKVGAMMYDDKTTVRQQFVKERSAIKRDKVDDDGKLRIIPKAQMKVILGGKSPDLMDMFMMKQALNLKPQVKAGAIML